MSLFYKKPPVPQPRPAYTPPVPEPAAEPEAAPLEYDADPALPGTSELEAYPEAQEAESLEETPAVAAPISAPAPIAPAPILSRPSFLQEKPKAPERLPVMAENNPNKNILSKDVEIKGNIKFTNELVIDGKIEGEISSDGVLTVGENADIRGEIKTKSVTVLGKVNGNITVGDRCELKARAHLVGDLKAAKLIIEEGATFVGKSEVTSNKNVLPKTPVNGGPATPGSGPAAPAPVIAPEPTRSEDAAKSATFSGAR